MWPFDIQWTAEDVRAVVLNIVAAVLLIVVGDGLLRGFLSLVFGTSPRLGLSPAPDPNLTDLDWAHLLVENNGLPLAPRTRTAQQVIASGAIDGTAVTFLWSTTAERTPEQVDIYRDHPRQLPIVVRARINAPCDLYRNILQPQVAYVTDAELLTQGHQGKLASRPLTDGQHTLVVTVQAEDGTKTTGHFTIVIPPWPGRISTQRR